MPNIADTINRWIDNNWVARELFHKTDETDWQYLKETYQWITETIKTREVHESEVNNNNKILLQADDCAMTYSLNEKVPTGKPGEILKISAVDAFLLPALLGGEPFQSNVSLIPDARSRRFFLMIFMIIALHMEQNWLSKSQLTNHIS